MTDQAPAWSAWGKIGGNAFRAAFGFGGAWLFWKLAGPGFEMVYAFAAIFAVGGSIRAVLALGWTVRLVLSRRSYARFRSQGAKPKADHLAGEADLRKKGLLR